MATLPIRRGPSDLTVRMSSSPTPGSSSIAELIGMAEQLVAAADAEHERTPTGRGAERLALVLEQVAGAELLVPVLAAAHVVEVGAVGVQRFADPDAVTARSRCRATRSAAAASAGCRGRRRCSSGRGRARRRAASVTQPPKITTSLPMCSSVGRIVRTRAAADRPRVPASCSSSAVTMSRAMRVLGSSSASPLGVDDLPASFEYERVPESPHGRGLAEVGASRRSPRCQGGAARSPSCHSNSSKSSVGGDRDRDHTAGATGARRALRRKARCPALPPSSWIVCIGTMISGKLRPGRSKSRASAQTVSTGRPIRAALELRAEAPGRGPARPRGGRRERAPA